MSRCRQLHMRHIMANAPSSVIARQDFIVQHFSSFPVRLNGNQTREAERKCAKMNEKEDDVLSEFFSLQGSNLMKQKRSFVNCCLCVCPTLINKWGDDERHRYKAWRWMYPWACAHMHMKVHNKQRAAAFAIISPWGSRSPDRKGSVWKSIFTFHMHHKTLRHKFFLNACHAIFELVRLFLFWCHIINICSSCRDVLVLAAWLH